MSSMEVFDEIYLNGHWGVDGSGFGTSGRGSHSSQLVAPYISAVHHIVKQASANVIVDLGCGDFNVGSMILPVASRYIAMDVSNVILKQNSIKYSDSRLDFVHRCITQPAIPVGDIGMVRQVLQHLDNNSIQHFVDNVTSEKPFPLLLVTEHLPMGVFTPNIDKPIGSDTRLSRESGIVLHEGPFHLPHKRKMTVLEVDAGRSSILASTLYLL